MSNDSRPYPCFLDNRFSIFYDRFIMDSELNQPIENKSWLKNPIFLTLVIFFFCVIVAVPILLFSLKKTAQKPQVPSASSIPSTKKNANTLSIKLSCPSLKEFCEKGKAFFKDGELIGLGAKLGSGSAIFAAFDGNINATASAFSEKINGVVNQGKVHVVHLNNAGLKLRATYFFRGSVDVKNGKVYEGQQIASSSGKPLTTAFDNNSLVFSVIQGYPAGPRQMFLTKENFK